MNFLDFPFFTVTFSTFTIIDLVAASTNAFNGALLCRRADHYRNYTTVGIVLLALIGGIGGGVSRDVLLNKVPLAFLNPWYIFLCLLAAIMALSISYKGGQEFRESIVQVMTSFSLPWYAVVGVDAALRAQLPIFAAIIIGVIGPTAGRYFIDLTSGVTPKHFVKGEWFVGTAVLTSAVYTICYFNGLSLAHGTLISFAVGFSFRILAQMEGWEEPEPMDQPKTMPEAERPLLGLRLKRELKFEKAEQAKVIEEAKTMPVKTRTWLPYLLRGVLGVIIAFSMIGQFLLTERSLTMFSVLNFPTYLGFYFLMNGILSFKEAKLTQVNRNRLIVASLASIIGGLVLVIYYPFSSLRVMEISNVFSRSVFGIIVIIIGLLQLQGTVHMTPKPIVKSAHVAFGFLEIMLGVVVVASPVGSLAGTIAFVWVVLVAVYMFYVARLLQRLSH